MIESSPWFIKRAFSFENKLIEFICSIIFSSFIFEFNCNVSIFCIWFSGINFLFSIYNASNSWIWKETFSFDGIKIISDISILFCDLGVFNIVIKSVFWISFSFVSKESIINESISWYNKLFFTVFNTVIPSNPSISKFLNV